MEEEKAPMGRVGKPEEVTWMALYPASGESSYVTGSIVTVDGKWTPRYPFGKSIAFRSR